MTLAPGFETIACPLCGSDRLCTVLRRRDLMLSSEGEFTVSQCAACRHQFLNPRPTRAAIHEHYREEYDQYVVAGQGSRLSQLDHDYGQRKRLRMLKRHIEGGRLIDVGCGGCAFLLSAARSGDWDVLGVEPSRVTAEACQSQLGLPVLASTWEDATVRDETADAITLWEVLEHLHDPVGTIRKCRRVLRPGGVLVISTPNRDSLDARLFGPYWVGYELPRHLQMFRQAQLEALLEAEGFIIEEVCLPDSAFFAFNTSLRFFLRDRGAPTWLQRAIFSLPLRAIEAPFFWVSGKLLLGSSLTTVARKPA